MNGAQDSLPRALHLVLGPGAETLSDCASACAPGDALVLSGAGVLALARPDWSRAFPPGMTLGCLRADARAQGLAAEAAAQGVTLLDDHGLVRLVGECPHGLSWT